MRASRRKDSMAAEGFGYAIACPRFFPMTIRHRTVHGCTPCIVRPHSLEPDRCTRGTRRKNFATICAKQACPDGESEWTARRVSSSPNNLCGSNHRYRACLSHPLPDPACTATYLSWRTRSSVAVAVAGTHILGLSLLVCELVIDYHAG